MSDQEDQTTAREAVAAPSIDGVRRVLAAARRAGLRVTEFVATEPHEWHPFGRALGPPVSREEAARLVAAYAATKEPVRYRTAAIRDGSETEIAERLLRRDDWTIDTGWPPWVESARAEADAAIFAAWDEHAAAWGRTFPEYLERHHPGWLALESDETVTLEGVLAP